MYHPTIQQLDHAAADFHERGMLAEKNAAHRLAGIYQQSLLRESPYPRKRRFLDAQWVWALGHIGLLYQLIRWFKLHEPETQLVLTSYISANEHFLNALAPHISFLLNEKYPISQHEAMHNAVYFGCPDGINSLERFYKLIEAECRDIHLLALAADEIYEAQEMRYALGLHVSDYFVALHARYTANDPARNVSAEQIEAALAPYVARGYSVVCTGLDAHPATAQYASVMSLPDPRRASFLLSASCDQFIGSNSGAWVIAHAYRRPVEIINDYARSAWIYP